MNYNQGKSNQQLSKHSNLIYLLDSLDTNEILSQLKKLHDKLDEVISTLKKNELIIDGETLTESSLECDEFLSSSTSKYESSFIDDRSENSLSENAHSQGNSSQEYSDSHVNSVTNNNKRKGQNNGKGLLNKKRLRRVIDDDTDDSKKKSNLYLLSSYQ